jgi:hypothetical protein
MHDNRTSYPCDGIPHASLDRAAMLWKCSRRTAEAIVKVLYNNNNYDRYGLIAHINRTWYDIGAYSQTILSGRQRINVVRYS